MVYEVWERYPLSPAPQLGSTEILWSFGGYGLLDIWVRRESTVRVIICNVPGPVSFSVGPKNSALSDDAAVFGNLRSCLA